MRWMRVAPRLTGITATGIGLYLGFTHDQHSRGPCGRPVLLRRPVVEACVDQGRRTGGGGKEVVLVTGGAGFVGQHIVRELQERDDDVGEIRVFDVKPYVNKLGHAQPKPVRSVQGDLCSRADIQAALDGVDVVIHTAGVVSYGVFPDHDRMQRINVDGTATLLEACLAKRVPRLIFTSTIDVVIGEEEIREGDETLPIPDKFLFPGYPATKLRAEQLVLKANGASFSSGDQPGRLHTLALRPNVMYGEEDPFYVTSGLRSAERHGGILTRVGDGGALFQQAYVGNMAWAHVVAKRALQRRSDQVGGHVFFITDDTPLMNSFEFMQPFLAARGLSLSDYHLPYGLVHNLFKGAEALLWLISPLYRFNSSTAACSVAYVCKTFYFSRRQAELLLGYSPVYSYEESLKKCVEYYKNVDLN